MCQFTVYYVKMNAINAYIVVTLIHVWKISRKSGKNFDFFYGIIILLAVNVNFMSRYSATWRLVNCLKIENVEIPPLFWQTMR